ncbi:FZL1 [Auxenochlorella protothecoides x Auxenochlorella symbiontica]
MHVLVCVGQGETGPAAPGATLYPAGKRQARLALPALLVALDSGSVDTDTIEAALAQGATGIVLVEDAHGPAALYEAAVAALSAVRGRCPVLIRDRVDVASATEADGVLLMRGALPVLVAKRMLGGGGALVGAAVGSRQEASRAAADGASFIVVQEDAASSSGGSASAAELMGSYREAQRSSTSIPLLRSLEGLRAEGPALDSHLASADGAVLAQGSHALVPSVAAALGRAGGGGSASAAVRQAGAPSKQTPGGRGSDDELVERERELLQRVLAFVGQATPSLEGQDLVRDALSQLDDPFLVVVVGEFNSGKSAVINALLGERVLAEGVLPTTNEISLLRWREPGSQQPEVQQEADGIFTRYLGLDLLRRLSIVDTPGTNVILERQQRLTEEYVPRADLVLFVMSADRPFTDSEVRFLRYIRRWGKKVVFLVNKVDVLGAEGEVEEVRAFVAASAERVLGLPAAGVLPLSARLAQRDPAGEGGRLGPLRGLIEGLLARGGESGRLKLETPMQVLRALLAAADAQLSADAEVAARDLESLALVGRQLEGFRAAMEREGAVQRAAVADAAREGLAAAAAVLDDQLQLGNLPGLLRDAMAQSQQGGEREGAGVAPGVAAALRYGPAGSVAEKLRGLVSEHAAWLRVNCGRQAENYAAFARDWEEGRRAHDPRAGREEPAATVELDAEQRRLWRQQQSQAMEAADDQPHAIDTPSSALTTSTPSAALASIERLEARATEALLVQEVRQAVVGTAGTAAGAGVAGFFATTILPTTLEDLLALALASAVGYVSVVNLPLRRAEAKRRLEELTLGILEIVQTDMESDLAQQVEACCAGVREAIAPLEAAAALEEENVAEFQRECGRLGEAVEEVLARVARLHIAAD